MFARGAVVVLNGRVGVVVLTGKEMDGDLEDHSGVWFGESDDGVPEVWSVPTEYLTPGPQPIVKH